MAKDIYHNAVKTILLKDGWKITDDPLRLKLGKRGLYVDLGAQKLLAAEREDRKIAVEVKSFTGLSPIKDLEQALGQYVMYSQVLGELEPDRPLYLAITNVVFGDFFVEDLPQFIVRANQIKLLVFDPDLEVISQWIL